MVHGHHACGRQPPTTYREGFAGFPGDQFQGIGHDAGLADDGHEIGIARPAGHDVDVQVIGNARAGDFAEVDAHVKAIRLHHGGKRGHAAAGELPQVQQFLIGKAVQIRHFLVGNDHQMAAIVGITVQHGVAGAVARDHEIGNVIGRARNAAENALLQFRQPDCSVVFDAPRRVE